MVSALGPKYEPIFAILEHAGFSCVVEYYRPDAFGNFVVLCSAPMARVRVTNERGQIFVDIASGGGPWSDKEAILESMGIPRTRHETRNGLWSGYDPAVQALELERFLPKILAAVGNGAA